MSYFEIINLCVFAFWLGLFIGAKITKWVAGHDAKVAPMNDLVTRFEQMSPDIQSVTAAQLLRLHPKAFVGLEIDKPHKTKDYVLEQVLQSYEHQKSALRAVS